MSGKAIPRTESPQPFHGQFRIRHHEMTVKGETCLLLHGLYEIMAESKVRDEVGVHDINVEHVDAIVFKSADLALKIEEIRTHY